MTRIRLQLPVVLTSLDPEQPFSEPCQTLVVNPQGCGLRFQRALEVGALVGLEHLSGGHRATARVATCLAIGTDGKYWLIGVALDEPGNIWGISDAPADWGTPEPEAAAVASASASDPKKSSEWPFSQFSRRGEFHPGRK
jgi:hypothetical protein